MPLADIVTVNITTNTVATEKAGFGIPLLLSANAAWAERTRAYTTLAGVGADFATTTPEYKMASAIFAQNPKLPKLMIGRLANKPTVEWHLTPVVANSTVYSGTLNDEAFTFTSDASATATEIIAGLKAAIDALGVAVTTSDETTYLKVLCDAAGAWFQLECDDPVKLGCKMGHAAPDVAADLDAIKNESNAWYCVLSPFNSKDMADDVADWVESNEKIFVCQSQDSAIPLLASASDTGASETIAQLLESETKARTAVIYHPDNAAFADAAWAGERLSTDPGSETWKFRSLSGVTAPTWFTATHVTNMDAKNCNYYYAGSPTKSITAQGKMAGGEFIDIIRGRDWLKARLQERTFDVLSGANKVPYTDAGIALIEAQVRAQLTEAIDAGFLAADPAPVITVPLASAVSSADKASRTLNNVNFSATVAGAIHAVTISGTISV